MNGYPAEHWKHLRTTNPIESGFATVHLRHKRTKGSGSRNACLAMAHQLMLAASKRWRLLNGYDLLPDVIAGIQFIAFNSSMESHPKKLPPDNIPHPQQLTKSAKA